MVGATGVSRPRGGRGSIHDDDHAGFDRPRRHTKPRTKDRPDYSKAEVALVVTVDRGRYRCLVGQRPITAMKARQLGRKSVIVGDVVRVVGDISGDQGTLSRIVEVTERRTVLRRTADDDDTFERPIVANADQLVIVTALADPPPRTGMIDRILVAGYDAGLVPILCLTKVDLASPDELLAQYEPLGVPVFTTAPGSDLTSLRQQLSGHSSVFVGHSGVGKSTLVNALIPGIDRAVGDVNEVTGRGRHTSTSAIAIPLPAIDSEDSPASLDDDLVEPDGWVIDTPGVRSFGLSHVTPADVIAAFPDLEPFTDDCPRGCPHQTDTPDCGLDGAWRRGDVPQARVDSFRRMISARALPYE